MDEDKQVLIEKKTTDEILYNVPSSSSFKLLNKEETQLIRRPIIASVVVFTTINAALTTLLVVFSASWYNGLVFVTYTFLDGLSGVIACWGVFVSEDFHPYSQMSFASLFSCCTGSTELLRVTRWRVQKGWMFILLLFFWLRPLGLYLSILGISGLGMSLVGHNSCTKNPQDAFSTYHPSGVFPIGQMLRYEIQQPYTFCTLDGRWGFPTYENQFTRGFTRLPGSSNINCGKQSNPGFASIGDYIQGQSITNTETCPDAYPNPAFGIAGPVVEGTLNISTRLCPGNTNSPVCYKDDGTPFTCTTLTNTIDYRHSVGLPRKVCSVCLNYWRMRSGVRTGPADYEHCARYSASAPMPDSCAFCPGRGDGGWLTDEKYGVDDLILAFWLSTTIALFNPAVEWVAFTFSIWNVRKNHNIKND